MDDWWREKFLETSARENPTDLDIVTELKRLKATTKKELLELQHELIAKLLNVQLKFYSILNELTVILIDNAQKLQNDSHGIKILCRTTRKILNN